MLMYVSGDDIGLVRREPFTGAQDSYQEGAAAVTLVESQAAPPSNIIGDCYAPAHWDGARAQSNDSSSEWLSWDQRVSRLLLPGAKRYSCSSYCIIILIRLQNYRIFGNIDTKKRIFLRLYAYFQ